MAAMITFQLEDWDSYYRDPARAALWAEHYEEIGSDKERMPMGPDVPYFQFLDARGMLQVLTARKAGVMIGYCLVAVKHHPHYPVLCGFEDSYFMTQSERKGSAGVRLLTASLHHLRKRGVKKVFFMTKKFKDLSRVFSRLGFTHCDEVFSKWIGSEA